VYVFLANGCEEIEALTPVDVLRRAGLQVVTVGVGGKTVIGSHNIPITADRVADALPLEGLELAVCPGGMPGAAHLAECPEVRRVLEYAAKQKIPVGAICAAPAVVLGGTALAKGRRVTCFPGFEDKLSASVVTGNRVERDGNLVTGKGMGAALDFALELVVLLKGKTAAEALRVSLQ